MNIKKTDAMKIRFMIYSQLLLISYDSWLMSHKKWRITEYYSQKSILLLPKHLQRSLCWLYCNQWCLESQLRRHQKQTLQYRFEFFQDRKVLDTNLKLLEQALKFFILPPDLLNFSCWNADCDCLLRWLAGKVRPYSRVISYLIISW